MALHPHRSLVVHKTRRRPYPCSFRRRRVEVDLARQCIRCTLVEEEVESEYKSSHILPRMLPSQLRTSQNILIGEPQTVTPLLESTLYSRRCKDLPRPGS